MTEAFVAAGLPRADATRRLSFVDIHGLLVASRKDLQPHNLPYAHEGAAMGFVEALRHLRPHILIGATGAPGTFTREVIEAMSEFNKRPVIFALSNPTSRAECTAEQAYTWSKGSAIFASGSPFETVELDGRCHRPAQGNNAYIFPGVGLGAIACRATRVSEDMFLAAARALASQVSDARLEAGALYPPLSEIRAVSLEIANAVAEQAYVEGLAPAPRPKDLREHIRAQMYEPVYTAWTHHVRRPRQRSLHRRCAPPGSAWRDWFAGSDSRRSLCGAVEKDQCHSARSAAVIASRLSRHPHAGKHAGCQFWSQRRDLNS